MGQFLLWVELVVASVLYVALGQAICSRLARKSFRLPCNGLWCLLLLVPWAGVLLVFGVMYKEYPVVCEPAFVGSVIAALVMLIASTKTILMARKKTPDDLLPAAMHWPLGKLSVYWLITLLLACGTFWLMDQLASQHMNTVRLEAYQLALAVQPVQVADRDNAAPLLDQAVGMLKMLGNRSEQEGSQTYFATASQWLKTDEGDYNPADPQMLQFIQKAQPAIALLHQAAAKPGYDPGTLYCPPDFSILFPYLTHIRNLGVVLCLSARTHADQGQMDQALADLHTAEALGRLVGKQPNLVSALVGAGINQMVYESYQYLLNKGNLPNDLPLGDWEENGFVLQRQLPRALQMEMAQCLGIYTMPSDVPGILSWIGVDNSPLLVTAQFPFYRAFFLEEDAAAYVTKTNRIKNSAILPYPELIDIIPAKSDSSDGLIGRILSPAVSMAVASICEADAQSGLMTLSRGMIRYRQANGKYPDSLDELAPRYIAALPTDPFSDQLLKMTEKDGRRILYSIGRDMKDDQGAPPANPGSNEPGDIVLVLPK